MNEYACDACRQTRSTCSHTVEVTRSIGKGRGRYPVKFTGSPERAAKVFAWLERSTDEQGRIHRMGSR